MASEQGNPRVSVIIPTYNRVGVLYYALNSVLNQTLQDFEVFVVDDASTDMTPDYIAGITDPRVHYIRLPTNRFAAAARNAGMERARGDYIAFLDSDDQWWPTKLEKQVALMDGLSEDWGCSYGGAFVNKTGGLTRHRVFRPTKSGYLVHDYLMSKLVIFTPTFMFRRSCLQHIAMMDEALIRSQDVDFYIRMLEKYKIAALEEPLVDIYVAIGKNPAVQAKSNAILLAKHTKLIHSLGARSARYVHALGHMVQAESYLMSGQVTDGLRSFKKAIALTPFLPPRRYLAVGRHLLSANLSGAVSQSS
jgi:glycosyltransferase involved in cell wall biosynthesis